MFFYSEQPGPSFSWESGSIFTENFNQALDTTNNWFQNTAVNGTITLPYNDPSSGNILFLGSPGAGSRAILGLKNTGFQNFTNSQAIRVQTKIFIEQLDTDNDHYASIRVRSTWNQLGYLNGDGYKIAFIKRNGTKKIQFITNNSSEQSGTDTYDLATFDTGTWYHMRVDVFPTANSDIVRVYKEQTINSGNWELLGEYTISASSNDIAPYNNSQVFLQTQNSGTNGTWAAAYYDDFKTYVEQTPAVIPST